MEGAALAAPAWVAMAEPEAWAAGAETPAQVSMWPWVSVLWVLEPMLPSSLQVMAEREASAV
jgi:hypothetical protein